MPRDPRPAIKDGWACGKSVVCVLSYVRSRCALPVAIADSDLAFELTFKFIQMLMKTQLSSNPLGSQRIPHAVFAGVIAGIPPNGPTYTWNASRPKDVVLVFRVSHLQAAMQRMAPHHYTLPCPRAATQRAVLHHESAVEGLKR